MLFNEGQRLLFLSRRSLEQIADALEATGSVSQSGFTGLFQCI